MLCSREEEVASRQGGLGPQSLKPKTARGGGRDLVWYVWRRCHSWSKPRVEGKGWGIKTMSARVHVARRSRSCSCSCGWSWDCTAGAGGDFGGLATIHVAYYIDDFSPSLSRLFCSLAPSTSPRLSLLCIWHLYISAARLLLVRGRQECWSSVEFLPEKRSFVVH